MSAQNKAVGFILLQVLGLALNGTLSKFLQGEGLHFTQVIFFSSLFALLLLTPWFLQHGLRGLKTSKIGLHSFRALCTLLCTGLFFSSHKTIPLMTSVLLFNSAPLFVPFVAYLWDRKSINWAIFLGVLLGFFGIVLILDPRFGHLNWGYLSALIAGVSASLVIYATRKVSRVDRLQNSVLYVQGTLVLLLGCSFFFTWTPISLRQFLYLFLSGVIWAGVQLGFLAFKYALPTRIAPYLFLSVVLSTGIDIFFWKESFDSETVIGSILVILSCIFIATRKNKGECLHGR